MTPNPFFRRRTLDAAPGSSCFATWVDGQECCLVMGGAIRCGAQCELCDVSTKGERI